MSSIFCTFLVYSLYFLLYMSLSIGEIIDGARSKKYPSLRELAEEMGIAYQSLQKWTKQKSVNTKTLQELSKHIAIPPLHFCNGEIHTIDILSDKEPLAEMLTQLKPEFQRVDLILVMELLRAQNPPKEKKQHPEWESYTRDDIDYFYLVERFLSPQHGDRSDKDIRRYDKPVSK